MKNDYNYILHNNNTRVTVLNGVKIVSNYSKLPPRLIQIIADKLELCLYGEISMYTGKQLFKVGKISNDNGGVINLYTTESKASFNRFICNFVNTK